MDGFSVKVIITSPWGNETWEWLGDVPTDKAEAVYKLLGKPDFVHLQPVAATHGSLTEQLGVPLEQGRSSTYLQDEGERRDKD